MLVRLEREKFDEEVRVAPTGVETARRTFLLDGRIHAAPSFLRFESARRRRQWTRSPNRGPARFSGLRSRKSPTPREMPCRRWA